MSPGRGRLAESLGEMQRAYALDPLSRIIGVELGWILYLMGRNDEAKGGPRLPDRRPKLSLWIYLAIFVALLVHFFIFWGGEDPNNIGYSDFLNYVEQGYVEKVVVINDSRITGTSHYADIAGSDVVVITAGIPRKPGMSRDDLVTTNEKIVKSVTEQVVAASPDARGRSRYAMS